MKPKTKTWIAAVAALLVVVGILAGIKVAQIRSMIKAGKSFSPPPESVTTTKAEASEWQGTRSAVATLVAVHGVMLGAELSGTIRQISFDSGASVKKGDVLVKLDTSTEEAQLAASSADAQLARVTLRRARDLRQGGSNTPADLEAAQARNAAAEANVAALKATIARKTITAPFDGRLGIRQVELGQVVTSGTPIASLHSLDPIYAELNLPQQALAQVKAGQRARLSTDIYPGASWDGELSVVNTEVDVATRNVRVRATFQNGDGRLRPGMFGNVEILSDASQRVLILPATALLFAPYGDSVFVVEEKKGPDGKTALGVQQRFVRLGERRGDFVAVTSGLKTGETVVSSGGFKLRNGMSVVVKNDLAPNAELAPRPVEQ